MAVIRDVTSDDLDPIFDLLTVRSRAAFGVSQVQKRHVEQELNDPSSESWVAVDGGIVGFARLGPTYVLACAAAAPETNDLLLAHAEAAARRRGFDHLIVYAFSEDAPLWALVERSGFTHERDVLRMWRVLGDALPEPHWANGVRVRTYTDADSGRVHALLDEQYGAWDGEYVPLSHADWLSFMTQHDEFDPLLWFLVERDRELVACALHWKEYEGRGWVKDIVVRESERGRGLGTALLHHGFRAYRERGAERVGLKVDSTNPTGAPQLYEKVGFVVDQRQAVWQKRL